MEENQLVEKRKAKIAFFISTGILLNVAGYSIAPALPAMRAHFENTQDIDFFLPYILTSVFLSLIHI